MVHRALNQSINYSNQLNLLGDRVSLYARRCIHLKVRSHALYTCGSDDDCERPKSSILADPLNYETGGKSALVAISDRVDAGAVSQVRIDNTKMIAR
jgi:hypothetical protein